MEARCIAEWIHKLRFVVVAAVVACSIAGGFFAQKFVNATTQELSPPSGSRAAEANSAFSRLMPSKADVSYFNTFVVYSGPMELLLPNNKTKRVQRVVDIPTVMDFTNNIFLELMGQYPTLFDSVGDYYVVKLLGADLIAEHLVSPNNRSLTIPIVCKGDRFSSTAHECENVVVSAVQRYSKNLFSTTRLNETGWPNETAQYLSHGTNGLPIFLKSIGETAKSDLSSIMAAVLPVAILVFALMVWTLRLALPATLSLAATVLMSYGGMYPVAMRMSVASCTALLMLSLSISLSLSNSYVILSRFVEEVKKNFGGDTVDTVAAVMRSAGVTASFSSIALALSIAGLMFFPETILQSIAVGCTMSSLAAFVSSVLFTPALLLCAPTFFEGAVEMPFDDSDRQIVAKESEPLIPSSIEADHSQCGSSKTAWMWGAAVVAVCVFSALVANEMRFIQTSGSYISYLGRHADATADYVSFVNNFGYGFTEPFRILFALDSTTTNETQNATFFSEPYFSSSQDVIRRLMSDADLGADGFHLAGPLAVGPRLTTLNELNACLGKPSNVTCDANLGMFLENQVSQNGTRFFMILTVSFDPAGDQGWAFYRRVLDLLQRSSNSDNDDAHRRGFNTWLEGMPADNLDAFHDINSRFPIIAAIVTVVIAVIVSISTMSVLIPLITVLCIASTEAVAFGLMELVYQEDPGYLQWTSWTALHSQGSISSIAPSTVFATVLGIAIAIHIPFVSRLSEQRFPKSSRTVAKGRMLVMDVWRRNRLAIAGIGCISAVAMFGMMLSDVPLMNVFGFALVSAALFEAIVVEQLLFPGLLYLIGDAVWWPRSAMEDPGSPTGAERPIAERHIQLHRRRQSTQ